MNQPQSRRDVLRYATFAAAAALTPAVFAAEEAKKKIPIAVQLYSVRNELKTDFVGVIEKIGKMGYQGVEFAGYYGWDAKPKELRKLLDDNGLATVGTHTALITLQAENLQKTIDLHKTLGNRRLICPYMQAKTPENWVALAKQFTDISAKAKEQDMVIGYHAHAGDFKKFDDGRTPWEIFFDNTPKELIHQIDLGNTLYGGGDPMAMVKRYPGRTKTAHIKEFGGAPDAAIGEGKIDWKATLDTLETTGGIECYIVEHETGKVPLESIKTCLENLHKMGR